MENTNEIKKVSPFEKRIHEIDFFRGLLIILVLMDHLFNLLMSYNKGWMGAGPNFIEPFHTIYEIFNWYWHCPIRDVVQPICLTAFCFLSGISCAFSKNNWKRAIEMVIFWFVILLVSNILEIVYIKSGLDLGLKSVRIDFNIIGVLAFSTLIYCFFQKKNWKWLFWVMIAGFAVHITVEIIQICYPSITNVYCPLLWKPNPDYIQMADHMPLVPYISFFFGGALLSYFTYSKTKKSYFKKHEFERPVCFLGRHTLIIYFSHMFVLVGIFALLDLFI